MKQNHKALTFYLKNRIYAVSVTQLLEVVRPVKIFIVNKSELYVLGMMSYHGVAVPVLDLKNLLGIETTAPERTPTWLAVKIDDFKTCLSVDRVGRFYRLSHQDIDDVPLLVRNRETEYIRHYFKLQQGLVPVIDVQKLLAHKKADLPFKPIRIF